MIDQEMAYLVVVDVTSIPDVDVVLHEDCLEGLGCLDQVPNSFAVLALAALFAGAEGSGRVGNLAFDRLVCRRRAVRVFVHGRGVDRVVGSGDDPGDLLALRRRGGSLKIRLEPGELGTSGVRG